jgi:hypothetical protein
MYEIAIIRDANYVKILLTQQVKQWIPPLNASGLRGNPVTLFMINLYYYNMMMPEEASRRLGCTG